MQIQILTLYPYQIQLSNGLLRSGLLLNIIDDKKNSGWGEIAPLPNWSKETLEDSLQELKEREEEIMEVNWTSLTFLEKLAELKLLPAVSFGLESALISILNPILEHSVYTSALLMGSSTEILEQAKQRYSEGYTSAKLKINNLSFEEGASIIEQLKDRFCLRIDVNRAWKTSDSLDFFARFPLNTFDYVEEPFQNPQDLIKFPHPLAVDESFPCDLSLEQLESLPTLKAIVYKPTIKGGMAGCLHLKKWATERNISLVFSSSFESDLGLAHIASMAHRLSLSAPVGIGTYHYLTEQICAHPLRFSSSRVHIPANLRPKPKISD